MLAIMKKRPSDEDLMNLFVLQLDVNLFKNHEFGVEYLLWCNKAPTDPIRCAASATLRIAEKHSGTTYLALVPLPPAPEQAKALAKTSLK